MPGRLGMSCSSEYELGFRLDGHVSNHTASESTAVVTKLYDRIINDRLGLLPGSARARGRRWNGRMI